MCFGQRRPHASDKVSRSALVRDDHIHVAFDDDGRACLAYACPCAVDAIENTALVKERGLGRVQVLGLRVIQYAPAKADHMPLHIPDGEHDAPAKTVIDIARIARGQ